MFCSGTKANCLFTAILVLFYSTCLQAQKVDVRGTYGSRVTGEVHSFGSEYIQQVLQLMDNNLFYLYVIEDEIDVGSERLFTGRYQLKDDSVLFTIAPDSMRDKYDSYNVLQYFSLPFKHTKDGLQTFAPLHLIASLGKEKLRFSKFDFNRLDSANISCRLWDEKNGQEQLHINNGQVTRIKTEEKDAKEGNKILLFERQKLTKELYRQLLNHLSESPLFEQQPAGTSGKEYDVTLYFHRNELHILSHSFSRKLYRFLWEGIKAD